MHDTLNGDGGNRDEWVERREQESIAAQDSKAKFESEPDNDSISMRTKLVLWLVAWMVAFLYIFAHEPSMEVFEGVALISLMTPFALLGPIAYPSGCLYYLLLTVWALSVKRLWAYLSLYAILCLSLLAGCAFVVGLMNFHPS